MAVCKPDLWAAAKMLSWLNARALNSSGGLNGWLSLISGQLPDNIVSQPGAEKDGGSLCMVAVAEFIFSSFKNGMTVALAEVSYRNASIKTTTTLRVIDCPNAMPGAGGLFASGDR